MCKVTHQRALFLPLYQIVSDLFVIIKLSVPASPFDRDANSQQLLPDASPVGLDGYDDSQCYIHVLGRQGGRQDPDDGQVGRDVCRPGPFPRFPDFRAFPLHQTHVITHVCCISKPSMAPPGALSPLAPARRAVSLLPTTDTDRAAVPPAGRPRLWEGGPAGNLSRMACRRRPEHHRACALPFHLPACADAGDLPTKGKGFTRSFLSPSPSRPWFRPGMR